MGIFNWLKKKEKDSVEATYEEAEQELQGYGGGTVVQTNPFQVIQESSGHEGGGCCGGGGHETMGDGSRTVQLQTKRLITQVTKDMIISDVIQAHPQAADIMMKNGLHCFGCGGNVYESIENGAKGHGMTMTQVNQIVTEINKSFDKKSTQTKKGRAPSAGGGKKK